MEDRKNWDLGGVVMSNRIFTEGHVGIKPEDAGYYTMPDNFTSNSIQALKDIVSSTEQMLKDGEINLENYQKIVESAVQGIKEIGLKDGK